MNHKSKKELAILIGLLILLAISVFSQFSNRSGVSVAQKSAKSDISREIDSSEVLGVDLLTVQKPEFTTVKRNIFQFRGGAQQPDSPESAIGVSPPKPVAPLPPAAPEVHYLGFYFEKETGLKMASLSNHGRVYVGKVGQVLGGKYEVLEIAADYVILRLRTQDGKVIRVPLGRTSTISMEPTEDQ